MGGVVFLLLIAIAAEPMAADRAAGNGTCGCTLEVNEVCGFNGVNYTNECVAECSGVFIHGEVFCDPSWRNERHCICPQNYDPVCGKKGHTFGNECEAGCSGEAIAHKGKCRRKITPSPKKRCTCTSNYDPVCGTDGKTYGNTCKAACKGVSAARSGKCRRKPITRSPSEGCTCPMNYDPVCGADRRTYGNTCGATCSGVSVVYKGACRESQTTPSINRRCPGACAANYDPVCGADRQTYSNSCWATCSGVSVVYKGACRESQTTPSTNQRCLGIGCPGIYKPVCGTDRKTYSNSCWASCSGVSVATQGECRPATDQLSRTADE